jgi:hypothetical protein
MRHRGHEALRPCDSRLGLSTEPVALRSCRRQCLGVSRVSVLRGSGYSQFRAAAIRKSG